MSVNSRRIPYKFDKHLPRILKKFRTGFTKIGKNFTQISDNSDENFKKKPAFSKKYSALGQIQILEPLKSLIFFRILFALFREGSLFL